MQLSTEYQKAKKFVQENKTVIACAATCVASVVITRKFDMAVAKDFAYKAGYEAGDLMAKNELLQKDWDDAFQFLKEQDLMNDFADWAGWTIATSAKIVTNKPSNQA